MPINWFMEVLKWKLCIKELTQISYLQAIKGVFSGVALGFITPHAVGDYFAKIWTFKHRDRKKALGPILVSRASQMLPTLIFGLLSVGIFIKTFQLNLNYAYTYSTALIFIGGMLILFVLLYLFLKFGKRNFNISYYIDLILKMKIKTFLSLFCLSFLRYTIFSVQFLVLLSIFEINLPLWDQFLGVAFMFLAKSVLPTFNFFNDLGVREFSAVLYFEALNISSGPIVLAGLILWLINIAIPALLGLFFVQQFKIDPS
jgi:hypothetical protein